MDDLDQAVSKVRLVRDALRDSFKVLSEALILLGSDELSRRRLVRKEIAVRAYVWLLCSPAIALAGFIWTAEKIGEWRPQWAARLAEWGIRFGERHGVEV